MRTIMGDAGATVQEMLHRFEAIVYDDRPAHIDRLFGMAVVLFSAQFELIRVELNEIRRLMIERNGK